MDDELYIGLMSGTSLDGVDAVIARLDDKTEIVAASHTPLPPEFRAAIQSLVQPGIDEISRMANLDVQLGKLFASSVNQLLEKNSLTSNDIKAIGSHGQTIRHLPNTNNPTTIQITDPNIIAEQTGITTVADFRRRDMSAGGQGAPLVPAFHEQVFRSRQNDRVILNLGGIANITILPADNKKPVAGFDTGPGNTLLNYWISLVQNKEYDADGAWAASGNCANDLLNSLLSDDYFRLTPPKSTGTEYFSPDWLNEKLSQFAEVDKTDVQTTLTMLTSKTIGQAIKTYAPTTEEIIVCGGGVHNAFLMKQLQQCLNDIKISSSASFGLDPDYIEATAFAWLAKQTINSKPGNLTDVTGANRPVILGGIYLA